jgi:hypothetical protein
MYPGTPSPGVWDSQDPCEFIAGHGFERSINHPLPGPWVKVGVGDRNNGIDRGVTRIEVPRPPSKRRHVGSKQASHPGGPKELAS